ncbi:dipeptidyl peptidase IV N-terminal region-domain-containing protein [Plectosphaerella cucumerina]|uniref:Probable dipeptidyl-aminopeptidase B n=1 Tax=Plectosphaerella cucumerina TaxID=40658 RepID=A0A8K0TKA7_9PEZI|nr:dipeptidyl peptidase IV N-terminal region-domain-containing protein [Plectosphaerella cucumerina]
MEETKSTEGAAAFPSRSRESSISSVSTTSLVFERLHEESEKGIVSSKRGRRAPPRTGYADAYDDREDEDPKESDNADPETGPFLPGGAPAAPRIGVDRKLKRWLYILGGIFVAAWVAALVIFLTSKSYKHASQIDHDPASTNRKSGKPVTLGQVQDGFWRATSHSISWIAGPDGEDGLLLERAAQGKDYLVVEDVRSTQKTRDDGEVGAMASRTLMKEGFFSWGDQQHTVSDAWPSHDQKKVLVSTKRQHNWRHSFTAVYWIFDVESQTAEPLDPDHPDARVQLATWNSQSDAIAFTRDNNIYLRRTDDTKVTQVTTDGGPEYFYGVPDWVYEEEVFSGRVATWWSGDGKHVAFLRTNETGVPEYPIQYFVSRPSGQDPVPGEENYPEVRQIKYPKAGSHNPVVDLMFYDVEKGDTFSVDIEGIFPADDRLINFVLWANGKVLVKATNRVSDIMQVILIDIKERSGKTVRHVDIGKIDGGWFEITQDTHFIPADPANGREHDGYVDKIIHDNGDHLAYYSPMDKDTPVMVTEGTSWEVDKGPLAIDLKNNLVYFSATKESSIQRHIYSAHLDGSGLKAFTDTSLESYYDMSFSDGAGYGLLSYLGPKVPWQKVVSTPSNPTSYERIIEENKDLSEKARKHELPILEYGTIKVDDVELNYVERRPPHFDKHKKYPVLFYQYSGPGSQMVNKKFAVDFQSYVASSLGYIVVTVDGRGTGFIGRKNRVVIRDHLGRWEAHDQVAAGKQWAAKKYVDASRMAIWGWSFGGFNTLKTLELDGGETFSYGMAVAPVTDWRFYDSVYTERYMRTPTANGPGYDETAISNVTALGSNVRFLLMHGIADDNVHMQNSLTLLDKLDLYGIENYDVHVFPDSDHGIYFHNANRIVYDKLSNWLINAFNGEWLKIAGAQPKIEPRKEVKP